MIPVNATLRIDKRLDFLEILLLTHYRESEYFQYHSNVKLGRLHEVDGSHVRYAVALRPDVLHH